MTKVLERLASGQELMAQQIGAMNDQGLRRRARKDADVAAKSSMTIEDMRRRVKEFEAVARAGQGGGDVKPACL